MMSRILNLIGAPSSAGAYAPGQEKAPAAFRRHGLESALTRAGHRVHDRGDVPGFRWRPDLRRPKAMNLDAVALAASAVADRVAVALADDGSALVLGGDCTVELGTVAGARREGSSVGLVYIDLDVDLNPPEASDGALDWTGVAHMLDIEGAAPELSGLGPSRPMLESADVLFFAAENITPGEARTMSALGLQRVPLAQVKADPVAAARQAIAWAARTSRMGLPGSARASGYEMFMPPLRDRSRTSARSSRCCSAVSARRGVRRQHGWCGHPRAVPIYDGEQRME